MTEHVDLLTTLPPDAASREDVPPERETPIGAALAAVGAWLAGERLTPDIRRYGPEDTPTYEVRLKDADGRLCSRSSGKGLGQRSMASALFESAEHYHLDWRRDAGAADAAFLPGAEIARRPTARRSALLRRLGGIMPEAPVLTRAYRPVAEAVGEAVGAGHSGEEHGGAEHRHPVFLRDGGYRNWPHPADDGSFQPLWHYTSSAGHAAGSTLCEALVHALGELIERDAWSCQLARSYFGVDGPGDGAGLLVVERESLPAGLGELAGRIEELTGSTVLIASIACDTEVPAYVVCDAVRHEEVRAIGSGASPVSAYAVQRALLEYLQVRTMLRHGPLDEEREARQIVTALARYPRHLAAARFDIHRLPHRSHPFRADAGLPADARPERLLRHLVERLHAVGVAAHYRVLTRPGAIVVVDVVAPGLELLDKARSGYPVLPTGRLAGALPRQGSGRP
ncbi:YcaO-like family protein [Streptomyces sp. NPDC052396]|uniref:YcaO-like family protein n=1 Tax=Streptomyces sp. NPDC052396 TaxID=3365689 RepID=UPI0037D7387E